MLPVPDCVGKIANESRPVVELRMYHPPSRSYADIVNDLAINSRVVRIDHNSGVARFSGDLPAEILASDQDAHGEYDEDDTDESEDQLWHPELRDSVDASSIGVVPEVEHADRIAGLQGIDARTRIGNEETGLAVAVGEADHWFVDLFRELPRIHRLEGNDCSVRDNAVSNEFHFGDR